MSDTDITVAKKQQLARTAADVRKCAYAPYSGYAVGAAVLYRLPDGGCDQIAVGCNVENTSYGLSLCAERSAIFAAVASGMRETVAVAVSTADGGTPCGACRQVLAEFAPPDNALVVLLADANGSILRETTLALLLPDAFQLHHDPPA